MQKIWIMLTVTALWSACQSKPKTQEEKATMTADASLTDSPTENPEKQANLTPKLKKVGMKALVDAYLESLKMNGISYKLRLKDEANGYMEYELKDEGGFANSVQLAYFIYQNEGELLASSVSGCTASCHDVLKIYRMEDKQLVEAPETIKGIKDFASLQERIDQIAEAKRTPDEQERLNKGEYALYNLTIKLPQQGTTINILKIPNRQNALPTILAEMPFDKKTGTFQIKLK